MTLLRKTGLYQDERMILLLLRLFVEAERFGYVAWSSGVPSWTAACSNSLR